MTYIVHPPAVLCHAVLLQVSIQPRTAGDCPTILPTVVSRSNMKNLYWNSRQQLVHHRYVICVSTCAMVWVL
jgi:hypothetical protein